VEYDVILEENVTPIFSTEDGGSRFLQNIGTFSPNHKNASNLSEVKFNNEFNSQ